MSGARSQEFHVQGRFNVWPTFIRFGETPGLAACKAVKLTPYFRAMLAMVSPAVTACVRLRDVRDAVEVRGVLLEDELVLEPVWAVALSAREFAVVGDP